jgi:hypothetical protein
MAAPLATLSRHSVGVRLYDRFCAANPAEVLAPLAFERASEAEDYLRHWLPDAGALVMLRNVLYRCEQSLAVAFFSDQDVLRVLAGKLASNELLLTEGEPPAAGGGWPLSPVAAVPVPDSVVLVSLDEIPVAVPAAPVLPALEELQIEGAEVLPEIDQTLEQIDMTMGTIDLAGVSLEPTPSKVPQIETAMTDAAGSVTKTLDEL